MVTDEALVSRAMEGEAKAFDELMIRYQRLCYRIAYNFCGTSDQAMDLVQDTFLSAFEHLHHLKDGSRFRAWILRITYNRGVLFKRKPDRSIPLTDTVHTSPGDVQEQHLLASERRDKLAYMLNQLNPRQRMAVVLKYLEQWSIRDIAGVLQCSEDVVKNMLYRSVRRMAESASEQ